MDPVVILGADTVSVGPGEEARLAVRVRNQGRRVESYRVDVVGAPSAFATVDPQTISVLPGREGEVSVVFRPPAGAATPTGTLAFAVRATSEVDSGSSAVTEGHLELAGVGGLQAWAPDTARSGRWSAKYNLEFANRGNAAVRLAVTAHDPAAALTLRLTPDVVDLPPGGRATTEIIVKARQPFLRGTPVNRTVQAACQNFPFGAERPVPGGAPPVDDENYRTFQLMFEQRPILSKIAIIAVMLVGVLLIGAILLQLRSSDEYTLGLAKPDTPEDIVAEPLGPTTVSLSWLAVPNALKYRLTMNDRDAGEVEPPPTDRRVTYPVEDLESNTEYCFTVFAVGPPDAGDSGASGEACATTGVPTELATPTNVTAEKSGVDQFQIAWEYPDDDREGVTFTVLVDNAPTIEGVADSPTTIEIVAEAEPRDVELRVQAVRDGEQSTPSEPITRTIDALPVVTSVATPTTSAATPPTTQSGSPTTVPTGATTTTQPGTTTSTTPPSATTTSVSGGTTPTTLPPPAQSALQDLAPTSAAMLGQWTPPSAGGTSLDERKARLAGVYEVSANDMEVFSNRDTAAIDEGGATDAAIAATAPDEVFIYVPVPTPARSLEICSHEPAGCRVMTLSGAAQAAVGSRIIVLDTFETSTPITDVDARIVERRAQFGTRPVHVLDGALYQGFEPTQVVVYASGFASIDEIDAACTDLGLGACQSLVLAPR
jgi:hypothetical protein